MATFLEDADSTNRKKRDTAGIGERSKFEQLIHEAGRKLEALFGAEGEATNTPATDEKPNKKRRR